MSARIFTKLKTHIVSSIVFFAGIITSACVMFMFSNYPAQVSFYHVCISIGLTFLAGLFSIHLTAKSIKQTVVYREHKKDENRTQAETIDHEHQLTLEPLEKLIRSENNSQSVMNELCQQLQAGQAALYRVNQETLELKCGFALSYADVTSQTFTFGEGLVGRVAKEGNTLYIDKLPEGYITIFSGLGSSSPTYLAIVPLKIENEVKGVLELAVFSPLTRNTLIQLETIGSSWAATGL